MRRCVEDARGNTARFDRDRQDLQNLMFNRGGQDGQWTVWNETSGTYEPRPYTGEAGLPEWVPRAVTNRFASKIGGIVSLLNAAIPALTWKPSTDDAADVAAAEVAQDATPVLLDEIGWAHLKADIHALITLTDKVAVVYSYDPDPKYGLGDIPMLRCPQCQELSPPMDVEDAGDACPSCGQADAMESAVNDRAEPITMQYPIGRLRAQLIPSFEFSLPRSARSMRAEDNPWILTHSRESKEDCLRLWGDDADKRAVIEGASGTGRQSPNQRYFADQMRRLSGPRSLRMQGAVGDTRALGPVVYRLQHDPIEDADHSFPDGLYAVMIGDEVMESGPLPLQDANGRGSKTILIRAFVAGPGGPWGKPPADDLIALQMQRNLCETLLLMILMHHAAPRTFTPLSCTLEDEITGKPGEQIRFRSMDGQHPTVEAGLNPPEGLYKFIEMIDQAFEELSGMNAVLQGQRPAGDPTLGEVQILQEQGQAAFRTALDTQVEFEKDQARLLLRIARQSLWSPRFRQVRGENGEWDVQQFVAASLEGSVDVDCDPSSAWPKSPLMQSMRVAKAIEQGILTPAQDPELQSKLLETQNLAEYKPSLDVDRRQVGREIDRWKDARTPDDIKPPKQPPLINVGIHLHLKTLFLKSEEAEELAQANPPVFDAMVAHVAMLQTMQQQAQMQQAVMAGTVAPPQAPAPDGRTPVEKGQASAMDHALTAGALTPAGGDKGSLDAALQVGALRPGLPPQAPGQASASAPATGPIGMPAASRGPSIDDLVASRANQPLERSDTGARM